MLEGGLRSAVVCVGFLSVPEVERFSAVVETGFFSEDAAAAMVVGFFFSTEEDEPAEAAFLRAVPAVADTFLVVVGATVLLFSAAAVIEAFVRSAAAAAEAFRSAAVVALDDGTLLVAVVGAGRFAALGAVGMEGFVVRFVGDEMVLWWLGEVGVAFESDFDEEAAVADGMILSGAFAAVE